MSPAGEMWSVVTESPSMRQHAAPVDRLDQPGGSLASCPSKNGGFWM